MGHFFAGFGFGFSLSMLRLTSKGAEANTHHLCYHLYHYFFGALLLEPTAPFCARSWQRLHLMK